MQSLFSVLVITFAFFASPTLAHAEWSWTPLCSSRDMISMPQEFQKSTYIRIEWPGSFTDLIFSERGLALAPRMAYGRTDALFVEQRVRENHEKTCVTQELEKKSDGILYTLSLRKAPGNGTNNFFKIRYHEPSKTYQAKFCDKVLGLKLCDSPWGILTWLK